MCAKTILVTLLTACALSVTAGPAFGQRAAKAPTPRDKYFLAAAEVYDELAVEHARLAELYRALPDRDSAVKTHAASARSEMQFAQRNYRLISAEARGDADISKRLKEIADREAALIEKVNKLSPPPVVVPQATVPQVRSTRANSVIIPRSTGSTRIPQSYYTSGEGHYID
jgi:hypothetical protein